MNTNQGKRMDQARIAELRLHEKYLRASGQMVGACLGECLDAIEAAQGELATAREVIEESMEAWRTSEAEGGSLNQLNNEIDRLRAELAALRGQVGGVVPELTEDDLLEIYRACKTDLMEAGGRASLWAAKRISEWFRRLTSSRVAGEGEDGPGEGDDLPCSQCGRIALDTGLECTECGHDNAPEIKARR